MSKKKTLNKAPSKMTVGELCDEMSTRAKEQCVLPAVIVNMYAGCIKDENARLRALVGELDIALSGSLDIIGNVGEYIQVDCGTMLRVETYREILAKAKEVTK